MLDCTLLPFAQLTYWVGALLISALDHGLDVYSIVLSCDNDKHISVVQEPNRLHWLWGGNSTHHCTKAKWTNRDQSYFRKGNKQSLKGRFDKGEFGALAMVTVAADLSLLAALSKAEICWGLKCYWQEHWVDDRFQILDQRDMFGKGQHFGPQTAWSPASLERPWSEQGDQDLFGSISKLGRGRRRHGTCLRIRDSRFGMAVREDPWQAVRSPCMRFVRSVGCRAFGKPWQSLRAYVARRRRFCSVSRTIKASGGGLIWKD